MVCLSRPYHFKFFKDCLPQILLGPFLNTLSNIALCSVTYCRSTMISWYVNLRKIKLRYILKNQDYKSSTLPFLIYAQEIYDPSILSHLSHSVFLCSVEKIEEPFVVIAWLGKHLPCKYKAHLKCFQFKECLLSYQTKKNTPIHAHARTHTHIHTYICRIRQTTV